MPPMPMSAEVEKLLSQAGWLRALAVSLLHSRPDADDAVQEVWAAALRSPPDETRPPRPWLAQVLRNVVRSTARRSRSERDRDLQAAGLEVASPAPAAEGVLARMEIQRRVAEQVMALEEPYRSTVLLRYYEGRPAVDIAREQDLPAGTVRWRINEGLRRLRNRLDEISGGDRERWSRALVPLGAPGPPTSPRSPVPRGVSMALKASALAVVLGTGTAWLVTAHRAPAPGPGAFGDRGNPHALVRSDRPKESEEQQMKNERLKRAAVFLGVVLPSLAAGAEGAQDAALESSVVGACVELHEKMNECRDLFVDTMLDLHLAKAGQKVTPEQRAKMREKLVRDLTEMGTGPLEPRQARCKVMVEKMGEHHRKVAESRGSSLKACYSQPDCQARLACMKPILEELLATELHAPRKK
jgi:RNA polymerase sigma-70 factor (ECF subfamily)